MAAYADGCVSRIAGDLAREARWGMAPTSLCIPALRIGNRGSFVNAPYKFVHSRLCIADCGFVRYFQKSKKFYLLIVILSERTNASRRISPAQSKRGRGVYAPNSCIKCYFACMELQRSHLDPATASPCGLLVCFAAPRKLRLRSG